MKRGKPLSFDRGEVLKRAMELFWQRGYEATGITELLEHMGIPRQSFYNTFGSKEELLFEAIDLYSINLHLALREAFSGDQTPFEKIDSLFAMWARMLDSSCGCFFGNCVAEFGQTHDTVTEKMESKLKSIQTIFTSIFKEAIERGDLHADRDPQVMGSTLMTYGQGLALLSKTTINHETILASMDIMKQSLKQ